MNETTSKRPRKRAGRRRFGAVVQEANGLFTARWEEAGRRRGRRGFRTRTEADAFLARVRTELDDGTRAGDAPAAFPDTTVSAAIDAYEHHRREKGNKVNGLGCTTYRLRTFFIEPD